MCSTYKHKYGSNLAKYKQHKSREKYAIFYNYQYKYIIFIIPKVISY